MATGPMCDSLIVPNAFPFVSDNIIKSPQESLQSFGVNANLVRSFSTMRKIARKSKPTIQQILRMRLRFIAPKMPNIRPERRGSDGAEMQTGRAIPRPLQADGWAFRSYHKGSTIR